MAVRGEAAALSIGLQTGFVIAVLAAILIVVVWWSARGSVRVGREDYLRDPPRCPPGVLAMVLPHVATDTVIAATLLDLSCRGFLTVREIPRGDAEAKADAVLTSTPGRGSLSASEDELLRLVFFFDASGGETTSSALRRWAAGHPDDAASWSTRWRATVTLDAVDHGLVMRNAARWRSASYVSGGVGIAAASVVLVGSLLATDVIRFALPFAVAGLGGSGIIWLGTRIRPVVLTKRGRRAHADLRRLGNYLRDFSRLDDVPPEGVVVWQRYLPFAVLLGYAKRALDDLSVPPLDRHSPDLEAQQEGYLPGALLSEDMLHVGWPQRRDLEHYLLKDRGTKAPRVADRTWPSAPPPAKGPSKDEGRGG